MFHHGVHRFLAVRLNDLLCPTIFACIHIELEFGLLAFNILVRICEVASDGIGFRDFFPVVILAKCISSLLTLSIVCIYNDFILICLIAAR